MICEERSRLTRKLLTNPPLDDAFDYPHYGHAVDAVDRENEWIVSV